MSGLALRACLDRLEAFADRYKSFFRNRAQRRYFEAYLRGLLGSVERKSIEPIALDQDVRVLNLQRFIGSAPWDDEELIREHGRHVRETLGTEHGVLVLDSTSAPKRGEHSVGVQRQWCGQRGKEENCQVWMNLEYASEKGHAQINRKLYLPRDWCLDLKRRKECGVPDDVEFRTGGELSFEMIVQARHGQMPHAWITGDEEFGKAIPLHKRLEALAEQYVFEMPSSTRVWISLPKGRKHGSGGIISKLRKTRSGRPRSVEVRDLLKDLPSQAWREYVIRAGSKGPIIVQAALLRVHYGPRQDRGRGPRWLLISRTLDPRGDVKYFKSNAPEDIDVARMLPAAYARWSIEQCHGQGKNEVGLGDYETRSWKGWHHHTALAMLAHHFLTLERNQLGEKIPRDDGGRIPSAVLHVVPTRIRRHETLPRSHEIPPAAKSHRAAVALEACVGHRSLSTTAGPSSRGTHSQHRGSRVNEK